jgi:hypothetical protein
LDDFSKSFVAEVIRMFPGFTVERPDSKSGRVGLLHRLCTQESGATSDSGAMLSQIVEHLPRGGDREIPWIVDFLRSTVPLLHNEAYQDARNPTGNAQAHFVRSAVQQADAPDVYWQVMGDAIARRVVDLPVG